MGTHDKGFIMNPKVEKGLEVYVDADFSGNWNREDSLDDTTARSRHEYVIKFMDCPFIWKSQLQHEITLSGTESKYTGLPYTLRETIPIMDLLNEMATLGFIPSCHPPNLNVKLHHFRCYLNEGKINIVPMESANQQADYLTKPVKIDVLTRL